MGGGLQLLYLLHDSYLLSGCVSVYLGDGGRSVSVAGHEDDKGPVVRMHENTGCLGAAGVERRGAATVGALDAAALQPLHPFPAVDTLLPASAWGETRAGRKHHKMWIELQGKEKGVRKQAKR